MIPKSCNSYYISHFAAFFIVVGAKKSIAESCITLVMIELGEQVAEQLLAITQYPSRAQFFGFLVCFVSNFSSGVGGLVACTSCWCAAYTMQRATPQ